MNVAVFARRGFDGAWRRIRRFALLKTLKAVGVCHAQRRVGGQALEEVWVGEVGAAERDQSAPSSSQRWPLAATGLLADDARRRVDHEGAAPSAAETPEELPDGQSAADLWVPKYVPDLALLPDSTALGPACRSQNGLDDPRSTT